MTIENAILLAFENNWEFRVERWTPDIQRTFEDEQRAVFDPTLSAEAGWSRERDKSNSINQGVEGSLGITEFFPTGTEVGLGAGLLQEDKTFLATPNDEYRTTVGLTVTQALMRGMGLDVNLASLRQARIDTRASEYELRGLAQSLLAGVENAYWDYTLAEEEVKIFEDSLDLANRLTRETAERIRLGQVAEYEIFSAEAEAATRFQELINARSRRDTARLRLLRLVNPPSKDVWNREIVLLTPPDSSDPDLEGANNHIQVALRMRPELNQARLAIQRGELEMVKTKNGLLPKLDLFIFLGRTGYADSFGRSIRDIGKDDGGLDFFGGLRFEFPIGNRAPRAEYKRSALLLEQEQESLRNLMQLVEQDVLSAYIEIDRSRKQITASRDTREFQKEKLEAEIWKYRLGKSTMFRVAQAERDLVDSQISAVRALMDHIKSLTQFYFVEGSLLIRRGISAPGREPAESAFEK
ncbi:MAG: TolC family protein [Deltaproteobacteria bacterium]|nr:TolC family protein [Deltaproteobacteria bacterium]